MGSLGSQELGRSKAWKGKSGKYEGELRIKRVSTYELEDCGK